MKYMKPLIQGETIHIDNHHEGVPLIWNSNQDIHLHKETNGIKFDGKKYKVIARISINNDRGVIFDFPHKRHNTSQEKIYKAMKKEIRDAFKSSKNKQMRNEFFKGLIEEIELLNRGTDILNRRQAVEMAFNRIMKCFDLTDTTEQLMTNTKNEYFKAYNDHDKRTYFIFANYSNTVIGELDSSNTKKLQQRRFNL